MTLKPIISAGLACMLSFITIANLSPKLAAEPLSVAFQFSSPTYADTAKTNSIVVKIVRVDQDPDAKDSDPYTVDCKMVGGSAVENDDFSLSVQFPPSGVWKVTFPPGVNEQSFTVYTVKKPGPNKTFRLSLENPDGPRSAITGNNPSTLITIVNPPPPPPDKKS